MYVIRKKQNVNFMRSKLGRIRIVFLGSGPDPFYFPLTRIRIRIRNPGINEWNISFKADHLYICTLIFLCLDKMLYSPIPTKEYKPLHSGHYCGQGCVSGSKRLRRVGSGSSLNINTILILKLYRNRSRQKSLF